MRRMRDPLKYGFYCVDYVYQGKDKVAVHFDMISAQQAMMSMLKRGVECKGMSKKKKTIWRLWAKALGDKSGKNDREADTVAWIRTFIFVSYLVTNVAIVANAVRHWNDMVNSNTTHTEGSNVSGTTSH